MRIARHHTKAGHSPYDGVAFRAFPRIFVHDDCPACARAERACPDLTVPAGWSDETCAAFDRVAVRHDGLPAQVEREPSADLPPWLFGARLSEPSGETVGESAATQVFDRIAGAWTSLGWRLGYFEAEADARAFCDEIRHLMCRRLLLPDEPELRSAGIAWAYGIGHGRDGLFAADPQNGTVGHAGADSVPPGPADTGTARWVPINDGLLSLVLGDSPNRTRALPLWRRIVASAWEAGEAAATFAGASPELAHVVSEDGAVTRDDATPIVMTLDLAAFVREGSLAIGDLLHAVRLATIAADLALMMRAHPTRRAAAATWAFRPLALGLANLAPALMAQGIAYDSAQGRATAAAMFALLSGAAAATSAELAGELGACPGFSTNREAILVAASRRRRLASGITVRSGAPAPQRLDLAACDRALGRAVADIWNRAVAAIEHGGLRNAALTANARVAPLDTLTRFERQLHGFGRTVEPAVAHGLAALGYREAAIRDALGRLGGRGTLADAPAINHATLRARGFTEAALAAIDNALLTAQHIRFAFNRWVLGYEFCTSGLGLPPEALDDGDMMLEALGFSRAEIAAANAHALGETTLDGAEIEAAHKPVFAGAGAAAHIRMLAAMQPFACGPPDDTVALGPGFTAQDCGRLLALAWRLGLPGLSFRRDGVAQEAPDRAPEKIRPREAALRIAQLHPANETTRRSAMDTVRGTTSASTDADVVVQ